jgi:hypothetical protein
VYGENYVVSFNHVVFLLACVMLHTASHLFLRYPALFLKLAL